MREYAGPRKVNREWSVIYCMPPRYSRDRVPSPPANPRIIYTVLKRPCMILYTLKYASKTHSKDSLTHLYSNNVAICSNDK